MVPRVPPLINREDALSLGELEDHAEIEAVSTTVRYEPRVRAIEAARGGRARDLRGRDPEPRRNP
jgi:hypothetical protein